MTYPQIWSGQYPPDGSGTWFAVDWGLWTQDPNYNPATGKTPNKTVPQGWYFEPQLNSIFKNVPDPTLDSKTIDNVNGAINKAKSLEDTKVGQVLGSILNYGTKFLTLLQGFKILSPLEPISYDNIDKAKLDDQWRAGTLNQYAFTPEKYSAPTNSTYFGIDFSKPLNIVLVLLGLYAIYAIITKLSTPAAVANVQQTPLQSMNQNYQRRTQRRYLQAA